MYAQNTTDSLVDGSDGATTSLAKNATSFKEVFQRLGRFTALPVGAPNPIACPCYILVMLAEELSLNEKCLVQLDNGAVGIFVPPNQIVASLDEFLGLVKLLLSVTKDRG